VFDALLHRGASGDHTAGEPVESRPVHRPPLALVLGGGAARGFAHVGVLRTLEAHGIIPDIIVGTSIGAVAGGCFAAKALDPFEEWARGLTLRGVLGYLDVSLSGSGLIGGNRLAGRLEQALGATMIEEMSIRFAAIACEVKTGHEIWLTRGRLVEALRASYALPGIFPPVRIGRRWLVDGALVNPVPVSAARALGARVVIAVNLNADLFGRSGTIISENDAEELEELAAPAPSHGFTGALFTAERALKKQFLGAAGRPGISTVMVDAFNVMQDRITRSRLAGDPPDVSINPKLGPVGWFDFHRGSQAIALGAEATEKSIEAITEAVAALA
jgi:NTE family protein